MADEVKPARNTTSKTNLATKKASPIKKTAAKKTPVKKSVAKSSTAKKTSGNKKPAVKSATNTASATNMNAIIKKKPDQGKTQDKSSMKDNINNFKNQATDTVRDTATKGKEKASEAMGGISQTIRDNAGTIDETLGEKYGGFARNAADSLDGFAESLNAKNIDDLVEDTRNFVRKSPVIAIGAAAAVGFLITRFMRAGKD